MEEKNLNEVQAAEQTTSQEENNEQWREKYFSVLKENELLKINLKDSEVSYQQLDSDNAELLKKYNQLLPELEKNDALKDENKNLTKQNADLIEKLKATEQSLDWNRRQYIEFMNQRDILKNALEEVCKRQKVSKAEMYMVIMTANDIDFDTVIAKLGKNL